MDSHRPTRKCVLEGFGKYKDSLEPTWIIGCWLYVRVLIIIEVVRRGGCGGKSADVMCQAQHVSGKPGGSKTICSSHSRTVTSIFECWRSFLALWFNATHPPGQAEVAGVEMLFPISNNEPEEERQISIRPSQPATASLSRQCSEMTLSIGVNWTPAPGFQTDSAPGVIKSWRYN